MPLKVTFEPTKRLFIDVLTKDITVRDCLLDLIDNSVDAYIRNKLRDRRRIEIKFGADNFKITDNCGGIKKTDVEDEMFKFGTLRENTKTATIGFYGIGLKRSIFKMGEEIKFETDDGKDYCSLNINVDEWAKDPKWTLEGDTQKTTLKNRQKPFTKIHIVKLKNEVRQYLDTTFKNEFKANLEIYYTQFLQKRLEIFVDGKKIEPFKLKINVQEGAKPANFVGEHDEVRVRIVCWVEPRTKTRTEREKGKIGWNVFMNERLVIHDDLSEKTGWTGEEGTLPKAHQIYNEFRGLVFLSTNTPSKLPIDTTKTGFNKESPVYKYVLLKMIETAKPIIKHLNEKYKKTAETEAEDIKRTEELPTTIKSIRIDNLKNNQIFSAPKKTRSTSPFATISYQKKKERIETVKKYLKVGTNTDVGSETFEYFWRLEKLENE